MGSFCFSNHSNDDTKSENITAGDDDIKEPLTLEYGEEAIAGAGNEIQKTQKILLDDDEYKADLVQLKTVPLQIENLKGCSAWMQEFPSNTSITEVEHFINERFTAKTFSFVGEKQVPISYRIMIGDQDLIDFENNTFVIARESSFIEYWNDFLAIAKQTDSNETHSDCIQAEGTNIQIYCYCFCVSLNIR